ncbi:nucleotide exchange factor GrpE [Sphingorhabdus sp. Alg239-R122]|uniref:nucleotide exchange factor GrpE n=1 Tax=Sphingorhabdus sp. Alg239-R122 TaxID=2305989 RepID=UPI0013D9FDFC|nr:nucleotide exchange factor GrpE [Sphingorhabdus sp. Alg239-R122]
MSDETKKDDIKDAPEKDVAVEAELEGVPEELREESDAKADGGAQDLEARIAELENELAEAKQATLYAHAEAQNVRRRLEKDAQDAKAYAATPFARDILSVADNLARAMDAIPEEIRDEEKWKGLITGLQATHRELDTVFGKHGVTRIPAKGMPLDPNQHQAMIEIPSDEEEPGTIVQEMQAGYMYKERLLRAAMVGVAKKPD